MLSQLLEQLKRPGLLGLIGMRVEKRCRQQLESYFEAIGRRVLSMNLDGLADPENFAPHAQLDALARHAVEMKLMNTLRVFSPLLKGILENNIIDAMQASDAIHHLAEADTTDNPAPYGTTAEEAALWASVRAGEIVQGINDVTREKIANVIAEGITDRLGVDGTKRLLRATLNDMSAARARMIASTEMNAAFSEATMRKLGRMNVAYKQWITSADACDEICVPNEEQGPIPIGDAFQSSDFAPPAHPNCLTGDAIVATSCPITAESIRRFEGEIVVLRCAGMDELSITPNHPILTDAGWIAAGHLKQGANLVKHLAPGIFAPPSVNPNDYLMPTRFEKVANALLEAGGMATGSMPTSAENFHTDASCDGEVNIVLSAGFLANERKLGIGQNLNALPFPSRHRGRLRFAENGECFSSSGHVSEDLNRFAFASDGIVRGSGSGSSHCGGSEAILQKFSFGSGSNLEASLDEVLDDSVAVDSDGLREGFGSLSGDVALMQTGEKFRGPSRTLASSLPLDPSRQANTVAVAEDESSAPESTAEDVSFNADTLADIRERFVGEIAFVKLTKIFRRQFSGHVYNLETRDGYYFANGLIVHNCRCAVSGARPPEEA